MKDELSPFETPEFKNHLLNFALVKRKDVTKLTESEFDRACEVYLNYLNGKNDENRNRNQKMNI